MTRYEATFSPTDVRDDWLICLSPSPGASVRLVMIPHAGGAPSALRPVATRLSPEVEVWGAQLPGRDRRRAEPRATSLADIVTPLADAIAAVVATPYAIFGHSMGGLIGYEVAHRLASLGKPPPTRLLISAFPSPRLARWPQPRHLLDDADLRAWAMGLGGIPPAVFDDRQLVDLWLPMLRADLQVCETYRYEDHGPLSCPVTVFGARDDHLVPTADLAAWSEQTTADADVVLVDGGHFYLQEDEAAFAARLRSSLVATPAEQSVDQVVAGVWLDLLGIDEPEIVDQMLGAGASSLMLMHAAELFQKIFEVPVPIRVLFDRPYVPAQAEYLRAQHPDVVRTASRLLALAQDERDAHVRHA